MKLQGDGFKYYLTNAYIKKLDIMIDRITRKKPRLDAWLQIHGGEGTGKTNASVLTAYYVKQKTNKQIYMFFRLEGLIKHAKSTEGNIYIWDEPSLDSLSTDQLKKIGRDLLRLIMTVRKKRHFFIVNFTKFWKFPEYVVVDRCLGMVHMYTPDEMDIGRFVYIKKKNLEGLWNDYFKLRKRNFKKYKTFHGKFPERMEKHLHQMGITVETIPNATYHEYEKQKDIAINSIGGSDMDMSKKELVVLRKLNGLRVRIARLDIIEKEKLAQGLGIQSARIREWAKIPLKDTDLLGKLRFETETSTHIINNRPLRSEENFLSETEEKEALEND